MFADRRTSGLPLHLLAMTVALVALALVLTFALYTPAYAAVPAQRQDSSAGMGGDMAGMAMMAATQPISTSMNMAEMGQMMTEMGQMMTEMGQMMTEMGAMMSSMPMTGTMSMDDMGKMMGMMGMMGQMHMKMGQMQAMMAGGMMAGDMGMMGKGMGMMDGMMGGGGMGMMGEGMMGGDKADATPAAPAATATPAVTATVPAPTVTPEAEAEAPVDPASHGAPVMVPAAQKAVAGAITVEVTPLATDDVLDVAFAVTLDTHSVDLSFDLAERATLTIGTAKFSATTWEPETVGGHHVPGVLRFVIDHPTHAQFFEVSEVTLELNDIDGQLVTLHFPLGAN